MTSWHPTQAIGADGQRADVRLVANGLKCGCRCFECGQRVVAKQGRQIEWHFAHYAPTSCRPTRESELHFFAKSVLAEHLWLWIPAVSAEARGITKQISGRRKYRFAEVNVEKADGSVRPDLILVERGGRRLHVEIFVRHKVDPVKREKLRSRGISSVEIDLSAIDWNDRSGWEGAVLETAPRVWLHNGVAAEVEIGLIQRAELEAQRKASLIYAEVRDLSKIWSAALFASPDQTLIDERALVSERGLSALLTPIAGHICFTVTPEFWQSSLLNRFLWNELSNPPRAFETKDALHHLQHLVRPGLNRISKEAADLMKQKHPDFLSPWHAVHGYLKWLKSRGMFDRNERGKHWLPSDIAIEHFTQLTTTWKRNLKRKDDLLAWADFILSHLPEAEHRNFNPTAWTDRTIKAYDEWQERQLCETIYYMVVRGRGLAHDFLGLPLEAEYIRQEETQELRRIENEQQRQIALETARRESRVTSIRDDAEKLLGSEGATWLSIENQKLSGMTPLAMAGGSDEGADKARTELLHLNSARIREAEAKAESERKATALEKNRSELMETASRRTRDLVKANLWCKSPHPKLGGQRPFDFCTDGRTLRICKEIMPAKF